MSAVSFAGSYTEVKPDFASFLCGSLLGPQDAFVSLTYSYEPRRTARTELGPRIDRDASQREATEGLSKCRLTLSTKIALAACSLRGPLFPGQATLGSR